MRNVLLASTIALLGLGSTAQAHFELIAPPPSNPLDNVLNPNGTPKNVNPYSGKGPPPCGPDTMPAAMPTAVMGGHTLHIDLKETVFHPGWYRIALGVNGRSDIPVDPTVYDSAGKPLDPTKNGGASASADKQTPAVFPIIGAAVFPHTAQPTMDWTMDLPIPNINCPQCTLQIEEYMDMHGSNVGIGGFFYHHCADLNVTADPNMPIFTPGADGGAPDASGKDAGTISGAAGMTGAAGNGAGGTGAGGTTGAAGSTTGAAGSTTGAAGSNTGAAGSNTGAAGSNTGAAGSNTGAAGSNTGAAGSNTGTAGAAAKSSGGCAYAGTVTGSVASSLLLLLAMASTVSRRRRRSHS
jgi:hypothetical protein